MRKLMATIALTAVLVLSVAAPAAAAPTQNPWVFEVTMTCGDEGFHDMTTGTVGFLEDGPAGAIGKAFGGIRSLYAKEGDVLLFTVDIAPPPGLLALGKLEACTAYVDWGDTYAVWNPIWVMRTPNYP